MIDMEKLCLNLIQELSEDSSRDNILLYCAKEKLQALYLTQSERLDNILLELEKVMDSNDMEYTYKVIRKLSKSLSNNRQQLLNLIEGV